MSRPTSLQSYLRWFREEVEDAVPARIHSKDIDDGGSPQWHGAFRAWLTAHPAAEDREGNLLSPLRYWMWRLRDPRYAFLLRLIATEFDWRWAGRLSLVAEEQAAHDYCRETLRRLHRLMYTDDGQPTVPYRPKLGECAKRGCDNKTTRLLCVDHDVDNLAAPVVTTG